MSSVEADQVRRELFRKYNAQIAALLGETAEGPAPDDSAPQWRRRFRVSYARQHLLRHRCLFPAEAEEEKPYEEAEECEEEEEEDEEDEEEALRAWAAEKAKEEEEEEEGWRTVYDPPFPAMYRVMRRVQDKALETLFREAAEEPQCVHSEAYATQRMAVLLRIREHNGRERIKRLAKEYEMAWKLPNVD